VVKALRSVLPAGTHLLPVGGINPSNMEAYVDAGATGFGIGSQLYQPGMTPSDVRAAAEAFMKARRTLCE
jgi:2-dehydro-3-deoxyphosphogalactonate aldolase